MQVFVLFQHLMKQLADWIDGFAFALWVVIGAAVLLSLGLGITIITEMWLSK